MTSGVLPAGQAVRRVPFDDTYLAPSSVWLQDTELVWLIRAAPEFDPAVQRAWYDGLPGRDDYVIWGIECDGVPIGAMGIKEIGERDGALYFMYVGERAYWRVGVGRWALREIQAEVAARGLTWVYGRIAEHNARSLAAHQALGMRPYGRDGDEVLVRIGVNDPVADKT